VQSNAHLCRILYRQIPAALLLGVVGCAVGRPEFTMGLAGLKPGGGWQEGPRIPSKNFEILLK